MIKFFKMQGLGNDYIYLDCLKTPVPKLNLNKLAQKLSNRNYGVGGDGLIVITNSKRCDAKMLIFNSDGSRASFCGNASRCVAYYLYKKLHKTKVTIQNVNKIIYAQTKPISKNKALVTLLLTKPKLIKVLNFAKSDDIKLNIVDCGNKHCVVFDNKNKLKINTFGKRINSLPAFGQGINVEIVKVLNNNTIKVDVFERGSGVTLACGSGAVASAFLSNKLNFTNNNVTVKLKGGNLQIIINKKNILMIGEARFVYKGEINC